MPWLKFEVRVPGAHAPSAGEVLEEAGAVSVSFSDADDTPSGILEVGVSRWGETDAPGPADWRETWVVGLFEADTDVAALHAGLSVALSGLPPLETRASTLEDDDWTDAWKAHFRPQCFGGRLWIIPSFAEPPDPSLPCLVIDPGLAFGTGNHETTALCLEWLAARDLGGKTLLDIGCGSGILALGALKLGAACAIGTEIDPLALGVARDNAARNGLAGSFTVVAADTGPLPSADIVLANILAGTLIDLAPALARVVSPGGGLVLAGLLASQETEVRAAFAPWFPALERQQRGDWVLLHGRAPLQ